MNDFDFDVTTGYYGNSESPGNEQYDYFSCAAAKPKAAATCPASAIPRSKNC